MSKKNYKHLQLRLNNEVRLLAKSSAYQIAPLFNLFGWEWGDKKPSLKKIERQIEGLVRNAIEGEDCQYSTGRITVVKETDEMGQSHIHTYLDLDSLFNINDYN